MDSESRFWKIRMNRTNRSYFNDTVTLREAKPRYKGKSLQCRRSLARSRNHLQHLLDFIRSLSVTLVVELTMERANFSLEIAFIRSGTGTSSRITHCTFKWNLGGAWPWPSSRSGLGARRATSGWRRLRRGFSCLRYVCWDMADNALLHNTGS